MVFEGITGVCERICQFNFKSIRKKGKYEFEIIGGTFLFGGGGVAQPPNFCRIIYNVLLFYHGQLVRT